MNSWERILNLYFILIELCCGAVIVALIVEWLKKKFYHGEKNLDEPIITYNYHPVDGQRYYDSKHNVWYRYENGEWVKNE